MQIQYHHELPQSDHRRPSRRSGGIIRSSAIGAPSEFPERCRGGPALHLGKIQTALLGRITPPVTVMASLAKVERARISERTRAGMQRAVAKGKQLGRPRISPTT